jgi:hypothetical protein
MRSQDFPSESQHVQTQFEDYLDQIAANLDLVPLVKNVTVKMGHQNAFKEKLASPLGLVTREYDESHRSLQITLSPTVPQFLPILLLREAYFCFVQPHLLEDTFLQFYIYMLIESELPHGKVTEKWKAQVRTITAFIPLFSFQLDFIKKFFQFQFPNSEKTIANTLFAYLQHPSVSLSYSGLFNLIYHIYIKSLKEAYQENEELLETIRVLNIIFQKVKSYRALLEYKDHFKELKNSGTSATELSLRKFLSNVSWLNKYSFCSPVYLLDWTTLGFKFELIHLQFHPTLSWHATYKFLEQLPFNTGDKCTYTGFSREYIGYLIYPKVYKADIDRFLMNLQTNGWLLSAELFPIENAQFFFNLNYYTTHAQGQRFIPSTSRVHRSEWHFDTHHLYAQQTSGIPISLLDWFIIKRARQISISGFGFERRESTLSSLRDDLLGEISKQEKIILDLRFLINEFSNNPEVAKTTAELISKNLDSGFFTLLHRIITICKLYDQLKIFQKESNNFKKQKLSQAEFKDQIKNTGFFDTLRENLLIADPKLHSFLIKKLFPLYNSSEKTFNQEERIYTILRTVLETCDLLKIFDLKAIRDLITNPSGLKTIYNEKITRTSKLREASPAHEITTTEVESRLESFIGADPPVLHPELGNSLFTLSVDKIKFAIFAHSTQKVRSALEALAQEIPHLSIYELNKKGESMIYSWFTTPYLTMTDQQKIMDLLHSLFHDDLLACSRVISSGLTAPITLHTYYDFENHDFFYTRSLFSEYLLYNRHLFGHDLPLLEENEWSENLYESTKLGPLISELNTHRTHESFDENQIQSLLGLLPKISGSFQKLSAWNALKKNPTYSHFIKSLSFIPDYASFGFQQYHVFFHPIDMSMIDLPLLFGNSFQSVQFSPKINSNPSFLITYLFPFNRPNMKYYNWLLLSKKILSEYCLFTIKRRHFLHNFTHTLERKEEQIIWNLDFSLFTIHIQDVLFNPKSQADKRFSTKYKTYTYLKKIPKPVLMPESKEFDQLSSLPINLLNDIKYLGSLPKDADSYTIIRTLLSKNLGWLEAETEHLGLHQQVIFLLPKVPQIALEKLKKVFKYLPRVIFDEIEGEYYLHSFDTVETFDTGAYIRVWFPDIDITEFMNVFTDLYEYLGILHVCVLTELYDGNNLLKRTFKDIDLEHEYNPLRNFRWNPLDKIWMNPKLFTEHFKPVYPSLVPEKDSKEKSNA